LKLRDASERWAIIGIAILMTVALGLLARWLRNNSERTKVLGSQALDRVLDSQQWRLDLLTKTFAWELDHEAAYMSLEDTASDLELIDRWMPVFQSRFAIHAIGVTDDRGDERMLQRSDSIWRFISSVRSTIPDTTTVREWRVGQLAIPPPAPHPATKDPREIIWFSQALDNRQDEPVWSEERRPDGRVMLHVSLLVRARSEQDRYSVIHFDIDAAEMLGHMAKRTPEISTIELDSRGEPLYALDTSAIGKAWGRVLHEWGSTHSPREFLQQDGDEEWSARIIPFQLNGMALYTGVMTNAGTISHWYDQGRLALWAVLWTLVLLGILLGMVFLQRRGAEKRVRKQERRSSVQARHLAQAIGQREVLDREVHHRVKNNLQVVSSLLNLQAQRLPDEGARKEFMRSKRRIDFMALVHHKLYKHPDLSAVELGTFLDDLAKAVSAMFEPDSRTVSHHVDAKGITCDADTSIQLGMILCELLANCFQHAFPYSTGGHIEISVVRTEDGLFRLSVKDNGKGYDPEQVPATHLGLDVAAALAEQLDGTFRSEINGGTQVEVTFKPTRT
jgi:two-component sensor histidine kinase